MFLSSKLLSGMFNPCRNKIIPPFQLLVPKNQWTGNSYYPPRLFIQRPAMFSTNVPKQLTEKCHSLENVLKVNEITADKINIDDFKENEPKLSKSKKSETKNEKKVTTPKKRRTISCYKEENEFLKKQIEDIYAKLDNIQVKLNEENLHVTFRNPEEPHNNVESEQWKIVDSYELNHHISGQEKLTSTNSDITNLNNNKKSNDDKKKKKINPKKDNSEMSDDLSDLDFNAIPSWNIDPVVSPLLSYAGSRQGLWTRKPYYYYDYMIMNSFALNTLAIYITHILKSSG